jgi:tetratricopeptide (TPR) repeat protein
VLVAIVAVAFLWIIAVTWGPLSNRQTASATLSEQALLNAGLAAQAAGKTSDAANDYHKILKMNPNNFWAYYNLGLLDQQAGRTASAESNYRAALKIAPDFPSALFNLAIIRTGPNPKEAEDLYRHTIAVTPTNAGAHLNLGFLLIDEGMKAEGQAELQKAVKLDPSLTSRVPPGLLPSPTPTRKP